MNMKVRIHRAVSNPFHHSGPRVLFNVGRFTDSLTQIHDWQNQLPAMTTSAARNGGLHSGELNHLTSAKNLKTSAILLSVPVLLTVQRYYGSMDFFVEHFGAAMPAQVQDFFSAIYFFFSTFLLMGFLPFLLVRFAFRERLRDYGLCIGDWRRGLFALLILTPLIALLLLLPSSHLEDFRAYYPFAKSVESSFGRFVLFETLRGLLFYSAWEFFFRGFMLLGLKSTFGSWQSVLIQIIPSCLWHIGTPDGEIFGSIVGGILFGVLVLKTRSLMYAFVLHWSIGFLLDFFILYL